jgi:ArsR family transcriptional regulator
MFICRGALIACCQLKVNKYVVHMVELDELLSVIENPARRQILETLTREPHYPLQLSKELGMSQQAVMKHLKVLEKYGLVESFEEESDLGGPMRKKYYPTVNFTIVVDVGPNLFNAELVKREMPGFEEAGGEGAETKDLRVKELRQRMADIDGKLEELHRQREDLIEEKERILDEVTRLTSGMNDYQVRKVMYQFISRPDLGPQDIAKMLAIRDEVVLRYLNDWLKS